MTAFDASSLPGRGIKPLVSLLAHPRLAVLVFVFVLLAGIPIVIIKGKAKYGTTATLQVAPRYMKNMRDDGELDFPSNTQYREFLEQQTRSVLRYDIVRDALRSMGKASANWRAAGETERTAVDRLRKDIVVRSVPDTYMIEVSFQSEKKKGVEEVVNAIVKTYVDRMKAERVFGADIRVRNLEAREREMLASIQTMTAKRSSLALQLGISAFTGKEENPYDRVLQDLRTSVAEARNKRFDAQARLTAFQTRGETDINTRSIQEAVLIDPGLANLKSNLYKRRADVLTQLSGLSAEHPGRPELEQELKRISQEINAQTDALHKEVKSSLLARYQTTADQTAQVEADMSKELADKEQQGARFAALYNQAMAMTLDLDQNRKELDAVRERLNQLAAEENSFGFVRLVNPALPPEVPLGVGKKKLSLIVLAVAFLLALTAPIARDLLDRRVHTVNDAERVVGIPAMGWMVERGDAPTDMFAEDLMRRLAGVLVQEQNAHGTTAFAFSAVKSGAGTSDLVLNLARTLDALGYPTLVVEANAFKSDGRIRGNITADQPGLVQCLQQQVAPQDCVLPAQGDLPARVWVGSTQGKRHIDRLDRIGELTQAWGQDFRFILFDIPPLLLSADAEVLSRSLAHLVLMVEADGITAGELRRAGRQVEKLAPSAVGMVVNRVRPFEGGGYLRELLLEYLTARKSSDYFSEPAWQLHARALFTVARHRLQNFQRRWS